MTNHCEEVNDLDEGAAEGDSADIGSYGVFLVLDEEMDCTGAGDAHDEEVEDGQAEDRVDGEHRLE